MFSLCLKSPNKGAKSLSWASLFWWIILKDKFWPLLGGDLSQNEKLSQIKPPFKDGLIFGFFASMNSRGVPACATFWLSLCSAFCALYFSLEVLGTIHKLRQHNFGLFLTHPLCQRWYSTERQQNWPFPRPTHYVSINTALKVSKTGHFLDQSTQSFCWRNLWMVP